MGQTFRRAARAAKRLFRATAMGTDFFFYSRNNVGDWHLVRRPSQSVTARWPSLAIDQTRAAQIRENLFKEGLAQALTLTDLVDAHTRTRTANSGLGG
jgi:hypothetical protein